MCAHLLADGITTVKHGGRTQQHRCRRRGALCQCDCATAGSTYPWKPRAEMGCPRQGNMYISELACSSEQTRDTPRLPPMSLLSVSMQGKQETDAGVHTIKQSNLQKEKSYQTI